MERALRDLLDDGTFGAVPAPHSGRMKAIREKGNKSTEKRLRALLVRAGLRGWVMHPKGLAGKPDFLFRDANLIVFVDGCYWHGCPRCSHAPGVNKKYWSAKIEGNRRRDARNTRALKAAGYRVLRVWEHELLPATAGRVVGRIRTARANPPSGS
jgi:DNA mismatch endonuclease, patch repair protein